MVILDFLALKAIPLPAKGLLLVIGEKALVLGILEDVSKAGNVISLLTTVLNKLEEELENGGINVLCTHHFL